MKRPAHTTNTRHVRAIKTRSTARDLVVREATVRVPSSMRSDSLAPMPRNEAIRSSPAQTLRPLATEVWMMPAKPLGGEVHTHVGHGTTRTPRKGSGREPAPGRPDPGVATLGANERFRVADREADARPDATGTTCR